MAAAYGSRGVFALIVSIVSFLLAHNAAPIFAVDAACPAERADCKEASAWERLDAHGLLQQSVRSRLAAVEIVKDWRPMEGVGDALGPALVLEQQTPESSALRDEIRGLGGVCGRGVAATLGSLCPEACPLATRDLSSQGSGFCTFACVPATEAACVAFSPGEPIPDAGLGVCRAPAVRGCTQYVSPTAAMSAEEMSRCLTCSQGYTLRADGWCDSYYRYVWYWIFVASTIWVALAVAWLYDLSRRPLVNNEGLEHGLATRSRAKLHTPKDCTSEVAVDASGNHQKHSVQAGRKLWPLTTNLCTTMVAGPGLVLHFSYVAMVTVWAFAILFGWIIFAYHVDVDGDGDLLMMGNRGAVTPAETCAVISWGHEVQQKYLWAKASFVAGCYVFSVALFMLFAVYQLRLFQGLDERETTHMDFCVVLEGLPKMNGDEEVEEEICDELEEKMGYRPVGVSIAWDISECHQEILAAVDEDLDQRHDEEVVAHGADKGAMQTSYVRRETRMATAADAEELARKLAANMSSKPKRASAGEAAAATLKRLSKDGVSKIKRGIARPIRHMRDSPLCPAMLRESEHEENPLRRLLLYVERLFLTSTTQTVLSKGRRRDFGGRHTDGVMQADFDIEDELTVMKSCRTAFAVFETEEARDAVVEACKADGFTFRDHNVSMFEAKHEPDAVFWTNFNDDTTLIKAGRVGLGVMAIIIALALWTLVFYLPYYFYFMSFNYAQGQWPGMLEETTFVMIIVAGNATMYYLCSEVADKCGFRYVGDRELCYVLMYYAACCLNVILDMVCAYKVAYMALVGMGTRESDGTLLGDITTFNGRFESYPMQRDLGWTVFAYAFPCTFLLPFLAEPVFTIILPYKVMTAIVGYRSEIQGCRADAFLACAPMDLSRYADVALNACIATLVFWFPSGLTISMFACCAFSHIYIYCYDQYRVLRSVPACSFSSMRTDLWGQILLAVPCGMLLSCALYKGNCVEGLERFHPSEGIFGHCKTDEKDLLLKCCSAFAAHVVVHSLVLICVVPFFGKSKKKISTTPYEECAHRLPFSFFSANPVHCLRSEYVYEHDPPFVACRGGKEHLMPQNLEIGAYFVDSSAATEDYSGSVEALDALSGLAAILTAVPAEGGNARRAGIAVPQWSRAASLESMPDTPQEKSKGGTKAKGEKSSTPKDLR